MKTVKTTLSAALQDALAAAPADTDTAKLHWVVNFWASTLDAHRDRLAAEQADKAKSVNLALVRSAADSAVADMSTGENQGAENVVAAVGGMDGIMREFAERKGGAA